MIDAFIRVIDVETTGVSPKDQVVEIAAVDIWKGAEKPSVIEAQLVRPDRPIPAEAMAIHHITDADVSSARPWSEVWPDFNGMRDLMAVPNICAFAAHKASFEDQWFDSHCRGGRPIICTWKAAMRRWPEAPGYSNQVLRYWLGLRVGPESMPPHRALPDAIVTGHILIKLLETVPIEDLIRWSAEPAAYPRLSFGKHRDQPWSAPPKDYLEWLADGKHEMDDDWRWNARCELARRAAALEEERAAARAAYVPLAKAAVQTAIAVGDMDSWWEAERPQRFKFGIVAGTPEYLDITATCVAHKARLLAPTAGVAA